MTRKKFTAEEETWLLDPNADPVDRAGAIDCMIADNLRLHEGLVLSFLDDSSEHLRASSLKAAIHWDAIAYLPLLGLRILGDPSDFARGSAVVSAWWVVKRFPEAKDTVLPWLARMVDADADLDNRCSAYEYFIDLVTDGAERPSFNPDTFNPDRDIDHARLRPYLEVDPTPQLH